MPKKITPPPPAKPRATKNPSSENDKISPLAGDLDMSLPVTAVDSAFGSTFLTARAFPHYLRRSGWIYLRCDEKLQARVKASKVVWQAERTDLSDPERDLGAGIVIEVDPRSWDAEIDIELGAQAVRQRDGFRYLKTNEDDTVTHYVGGRPVSEEVDEDIDLTE